MKFDAESAGILTGYMMVGGVVLTVWLIWRRATR
jgi:hypothetical protein